MSNSFITLTENDLKTEHICCAFSDKKCVEGYNLKKVWLSNQFKDGFIFRRLDERAKVFIEYCPAETAWMPIDAPDYLVLGCFWVSGQYKGQGYAKALLQSAIDDAIVQNKNGLIAIVGAKKFHFMSDGKWLINQGFELVDRLPNGFDLLVKKLKQDALMPQFSETVKTPSISQKGLVAYYSNRCPFTEYHVNISLPDTARKRNIPLQIVKLETLEQAQTAPTPATIFSLFYNGKFITTDLSACMDSRFDKVVKI